MTTYQGRKNMTARHKGLSGCIRINMPHYFCITPLRLQEVSLSLSPLFETWKKIVRKNSRANSREEEACMCLALAQDFTQPFFSSDFFYGLTPRTKQKWDYLWSKLLPNTLFYCSTTMYLCNKPLPQEAEKRIKFFFVAAQISKEQIYVLQRTW